MRIFHIATVADWDDAARAGEYRISTLGKSLDDVGFIHAAYREQVPDVYDEFYADLKDPLVLLHIEPSRLTSPMQEDRVGDRIYPHIYGPLNRQAVVDVQPLDLGGRPITFSRVMLKEMAWRMAAGLLFMLFVVLGVMAAAPAETGWLTLLGGIVGAAVGVVVWRAFSRRFG